MGLFTALLLAEGGVQVRIIDESAETAAHSYACALHPRTLRLLDDLGLADAAIAAGHRIETVAFHDGAARKAEVKLSALPGRFPFALVLPQNDLEALLEAELRRRAHLKVNWNHRLSNLEPAGDGAVATVDKLAETAKGYIVAEWDWTVEKTLHTRAAFVVGADGHGSLVRQRLGIEYEALGPPQEFAVYEFTTDAAPGHEARVALDDQAVSVMWPLSDTRCRWSFQVVHPAERGEFPAKDRLRVQLDEPEVEAEWRRQFQRLAAARAPWFTGAVGGLGWATEVQFEPRLARQFGRGHCWLAGDAAHQTSPAGMQSMNVGLCEADDLARKLRQILREGAAPALLETYGANRRDEWQCLLGLTGGLRARAATDPWVAKRAARLLPCLPACGEELQRLAAQLGLDY